MRGFANTTYALIASPAFWLWGACVALCLGLAGLALAKLLLPAPLNYFHTTYMSLVIPQNWDCTRDPDTFTCRRLSTGDTVEPRNAIVIFTAKQTGEQDTFDIYRAHLETPRETLYDDSPVTQSIVEDVRDQVISERRWVVGRHLHSEVFNYRTWYFATVAENISVLITFSAHVDFTDDYLEDVDTMIQNLELSNPVEKTPLR